GSIWPWAVLVAQNTSKMKTSASLVRIVTAFVLQKILAEANHLRKQEDEAGTRILRIHLPLPSQTSLTLNRNLHLNPNLLLHVGTLSRLRLRLRSRRRWRFQPASSTFLLPRPFRRVSFRP